MAADDLLAPDAANEKTQPALGLARVERFPNDYQGVIALARLPRTLKMQRNAHLRCVAGCRCPQCALAVLQARLAAAVDR